MDLTASEAAPSQQRYRQDRDLVTLLTDALQHLGYNHVTLERAQWEYAVVVQVRLRPPVHMGPAQVLHLSHVISDVEREALRGQEETLVGHVIAAIQLHHKVAAMAYAVQRNKDLHYDY